MQLTTKKGYDTLPWIEKYRPSTLNEVLSHNNIIQTLKKFIESRCLPHLLFYGPPGTGKTSTIMACAKELYGDYYPYMVMELNASDDRGIEVVRTKIKQFVTSNSVFFGNNSEDRKSIFKMVILDETDAMTGDAQAILRKVVEAYTYNTRFCLICNYIQNIIPALQSRCTRFRFSPIPKADMRLRVVDIIKKEKIKVTKTGLEVIFKRSGGDMRKVLNDLQSVSMAYELINEKNINTCLGYPRKLDIDKCINAIINDPYYKAYSCINTLKKDNGLSLMDIITEIYNLIIEYIINGTSDNDNISKLEINDCSIVLDKMRHVEFNQSTDTSEDIQLAAFIGVFKLIL
jgi:replication factor C subunit 3/5